MKSLVVGKCSYNFICKVDKTLEPNSFNQLTDVKENAGGFGFDASYLLGKFGVESYAAGIVGDDTFGSLFRKTLEKVGVQTSGIETAYDKRTLINFYINNVKEKNYISNDIAKEKIFMKKNEFAVSPDIILVDGADYSACLGALNTNKNKTCIVVTGELSQDVVELCKYGTYIIATREFAEYFNGGKIDLTNAPTLVSGYTALAKKFPNKNIIINFEDSGVLYVNNNQIKLMPPIKGEFIDKSRSLGVLAAGFAYGLMQNFDMEKAITFATIASSLSMTKEGIEGFPDLSDIMPLFKQKYPDGQ